MDIKALYQKYRSVLFYLFFGVLTTVINIVTYHLCYEVMGWPNVRSNIFAWILAVTVAYLTNKVWVFDSQSFAPSILLPELWKFVSCRIATGAVDLAIMWIGVDLLMGPATLTKIGSNAIVVVLNYVLSKLVIFRKKK